MLNIGGAAQMMKTEAVAGKTYYVQLNNNVWGGEGASVYRFCPVRTGTDNPMTNTEIGTFQTSPEQESEGRMKSAAKHIAAVYLAWDEYSDELKQRFTTAASDGR